MTHPHHQHPKQFINPDVYFMTHSSSRGFSKEHYDTYDEARKIVEEDRLKCEQNGQLNPISTWLLMSVITISDRWRTNKVLSGSKRVVENPMVVMFEQATEYQIIPKGS